MNNNQINLFYVLLGSQEKQKKDAEAASAGKLVKQSAGELRLQKGELEKASILVDQGKQVKDMDSQSMFTGVLNRRQSNIVLGIIMLADISELDLPRGVSISFPEGSDKIMNFEIVMKPDEGLYR